MIVKPGGTAISLTNKHHAARIAHHLVIRFHWFNHQFDRKTQKHYMVIPDSIDLLDLQRRLRVTFYIDGGPDAQVAS